MPTRALATVAALLCFAPLLARAQDGIASPDRAPRTFLLAVGKGKAVDPPRQQQRAIEAVRMVTEAAKGFQPTVVVDALAEKVMTKEEIRAKDAAVRVSGDIFRKRMRELARRAGPRDTVIVYTHTHGSRATPERPGLLAGIVLNPGSRRTGVRGVMTWEEYADLILAIPARNVVVLTMACYSGGLVERLNAPGVRERWENRQSAEERNLIVLTSQNDELQSPPILKDREVVNPFTYALAEALAGGADGFRLADGQPAAPAARDGKITAGELVDFVLYTTAHTPTEAPGRTNNADPQVTGAFDRDTVLFERSGAAGRDCEATR